MRVVRLSRLRVYSALKYIEYGFCYSILRSPYTPYTPYSIYFRGTIEFRVRGLGFVGYGLRVQDSGQQLGNGFAGWGVLARAHQALNPQP